MRLYKVICQTKGITLATVNKIAEARARKDFHRRRTGHVVEIVQISENLSNVPGKKLLEGNIDGAKKVK